MLKKLSIVAVIGLIAVAVFAATYDNNYTGNTYPMIYRMNIQNSDGSRGVYYNTTHPKSGWGWYTATGADPVSANLSSGEAVFYYDSTKNNAGFVGMQKDVSGNWTNGLVLKAATITTLTTTTLNVNVTDTTTTNTLVATTGTITNLNSTSATVNTLVAPTTTITTANITTLDVAGLAQVDSFRLDAVTGSATVGTGNVTVTVNISGTNYHLLLRSL